MILTKLWLLLLLLFPVLSTVVIGTPLASPCSHDPLSNASSTAPSPSLNKTSSAWSTRMIASIISRQQGLASSGEVTSTLESGLISLGIQSWLGLYASSSTSSDDQTTASTFASYVDAVLQGVSATAAFTNASAAAQQPLDRLTVAQAIAGLEREPVRFDGGDEEGGEGGLTQPGIETGGTNGVEGGGGGRQLTADETLALSALNESLAVQERNQYGGFWYYVYPSWSYLDGVVSFLPFMASPRQRWAPADALLQIRLLYAACHQNATGLLAHGYDASRTAVWADPTTGASPYAWGRSMGWYLAGLVNAWEVLAANSSGSGSGSGPGGGAGSDDDDDGVRSCADQADCAALLSTIRSQFTALAHALLRWQDPATGAWWQLPAFPGGEGNYLETSSTALFAFAMLKSLRLGLLLPSPPPPPPSTSPSPLPPAASHAAAAAATTAATITSSTDVRGAALRAYDYLLASAVVQQPDGTLGYDGTVAVCSLNSTASYEYYTSQPLRPDAPLGEGAFVLASLEVERLFGLS